eukprot:m51a1_g9018 hypothetical protein (365) ;mRNA; f:176055-177672
MRFAFGLLAVVLCAAAESDNYWVELPGLKAQCVDSDTAGNIWAVDLESNVWFLPAHQANWTQVVDNDGLSMSQVSVNGEGVVWGISEAAEVVFRVGITLDTPMGTRWESITGLIAAQLSVGPKGYVVAVDGQDQIFWRRGISYTNPLGTSWQQLDGAAMKVSFYSSGWGFAVINRENQLFYRHASAVQPWGYEWALVRDSTWGVSSCSDWEYALGVTGTISIGPNGNIIGVTTAGKTWYRVMVPLGPWLEIDGLLSVVSWGPGWQIWGITTDGRVVVRAGASAVKPKGLSWQTVSGPSLVWLSVGRNITAGLTATGEVWIRKGITSRVGGTEWERIPGSMRSIDVNGADQIRGVSDDNKNWIMP